MNIKLYSAVAYGIDAQIVPIEVSLGTVEKKCEFNIIGVSSSTAKESKLRIKSALAHCDVALPLRDITVNIIDANNKFHGETFDVAIAAGIVSILQHIKLSPTFINETLFMGSLGLDGAFNNIKGVLPVVLSASNLNIKRIVMSVANAQESSIVEDVDIIGIDHLNTLIDYLSKKKKINSMHSTPLNGHDYKPNYAVLNDIKGQDKAKRALQIAAAGRHNILFIGPPGSGKTMLAERIRNIMPPMTTDEILQTSKIYSISRKIDNNSLVKERPFRSPHHTITYPGLIGGGKIPQPGEISLSHNGILFLDELPEFNGHALETLREPLEKKTINIARAHRALEFPANFLLVAAMNPCPCGYLGDAKRPCKCNAGSIKNYLNRVSGPLLDRIDLQVPLQAVDYADLLEDNKHMDLDAYYDKIMLVNERQKKFKELSNFDVISQYCALSNEAESIIKIAFDKLNLTMRGYHKTLRIARTIADLDNCDDIKDAHIKEALMFRSLDKTIEKWKK